MSQQAAALAREEEGIPHDALAELLQRISDANHTQHPTPGFWSRHPMLLTLAGTAVMVLVFTAALAGISLQDHTSPDPLGNPADVSDGGWAMFIIPQDVAAITAAFHRASADPLLAEETRRLFENAAYSMVYVEISGHYGRAFATNPRFGKPSAPFQIQLPDLVNGGTNTMTIFGGGGEKSLRFTSVDSRGEPRRYDISPGWVMSNMSTWDREWYVLYLGDVANALEALTQAARVSGQAADDMAAMGGPAAVAALAQDYREWALVIYAPADHYNHAKFTTAWARAVEFWTTPEAQQKLSAAGISFSEMQSAMDAINAWEDALAEIAAGRSVRSMARIAQDAAGGMEYLLENTDALVGAFPEMGYWFQGTSMGGGELGYGLQYALTVADGASRILFPARGVELVAGP